jgi:hypothetical protein
MATRGAMKHTAWPPCASSPWFFRSCSCSVGAAPSATRLRPPPWPLQARVALRLGLAREPVPKQDSRLGGERAMATLVQVERSPVAGLARAALPLQSQTPG